MKNKTNITTTADWSKTFVSCSCLTQWIHKTRERRDILYTLISFSGADPYPYLLHPCLISCGFKLLSLYVSLSLSPGYSFSKIIPRPLSCDVKLIVSSPASVFQHKKLSPQTPTPAYNLCQFSWLLLLNVHNRYQSVLCPCVLMAVHTSQRSVACCCF